MRSEHLSRVIDSFGPTDVQKRRMLESITGQVPATKRRNNRPVKILGLAAAVFLIAGTSAAFSNLQLFRDMFGSGIHLVEDRILFPMESASDDHFRLTLEGVLPDEFMSIVIVSVEALQEQSRAELAHIASVLQVRPHRSDIRANHSSVVELEHLSEPNTKRFMIEIISLDGPLDGNLEIQLKTETSLLTLLAPTDGTIPFVSIEPDEAHYASADYVPQTVRISPLGVVVKGVEKTIGHEIPHPRVILHFANGSTIDVFRQVPGFSGSRFPEEGIVTMSARFENIIDLRQLRSVTVDGREYRASLN